MRQYPRAQLFELSSGAQPFSTHPANLPIIAYSPEGVLDVRVLGDYQAARFAPRRDSKTGFQEISATLSIFGGVPTAAMAIRRIKLRQSAGKS